MNPELFKVGDRDLLQFRSTDLETYPKSDLPTQKLTEN
jgi:hypothetical protein